MEKVTNSATKSNSFTRYPNLIARCLRAAEGHFPAAALLNMIVLRVYEDFDRLMGLLESGRFFWSAREAIERGPVALLPLPEPFRSVRGQIFQLGGLYTNTSCRGSGLGWHLVRMIRATGMGVFNCDHSVGIESAEIAEADDFRMPLQYYGYARVTPLARNFLMDKSFDLLYLTHISRKETAARWPADKTALSLITQPDPQQLVAVV